MKNDNEKFVLLLQPCDPSGKFPYLPNGIISVAARLKAGGIRSKIIDFNISDEIPAEDLDQADLIGIGMLGAPYIYPALQLAQNIRDRGFTQHIFLGGPIASKIRENEWKQIIGQMNLIDIFVMQNEEELKMSLGIPHLPSIYDVSMGPVIESLPEQMLQIYFSRPFAIFTSNGCIFNCDHCGADKKRPEQFRNTKVFREEMATLAAITKKYGGQTPDHELYLSSLDGLQNPDKMEPILQIIQSEFARAGVSVTLRFLATSKMTFEALKRDPKILERWHEAYRVVSIGIGIDGGGSEKGWLKMNKAHNKMPEIRKIMREIKHSGITAEALMVIGLSSETLWETMLAVWACMLWTLKGMQVRPYLGKRNTPTEDKKNWSLKPFLPDVSTLSHLDYGMFGSKSTHPNTLQRWQANIAYGISIIFLNLFNPYGCPTNPLLPTQQGNRWWRKFAEWWNQLMPGDK